MGRMNYGLNSCLQNTSKGDWSSLGNVTGLLQEGIRWVVRKERLTSFAKTTGQA